MSIYKCHNCNCEHGTKNVVAFCAVCHDKALAQGRREAFEEVRRAWEHDFKRYNIFGKWLTEAQAREAGKSHPSEFTRAATGDAARTAARAAEHKKMCALVRRELGKESFKELARGGGA